MALLKSFHEQLPGEGDAAQTSRFSGTMKRRSRQMHRVEESRPVWEATMASTELCGHRQGRVGSETSEQG